MKWEFEGEKFEVGEDLTTAFNENIVRNEGGSILVFFQKKLYKFFPFNFHESNGVSEKEKILIFDFFNKEAKGFWTKPKRVFQVIKTP